MSVKILKRSKKISIRMPFTAMFALRMAVGNYLYQNPDDENMADFYTTLPGEDVYSRSWHSYGRNYNVARSGAGTIRFDIIHLDPLIRAMKMILGGGWPLPDTMDSRVEALEKISPLEALGMAAGE